MPRATNNPASRRRRKKVLNRAKGFYSGRRKLFQNARETVKRALAYAYRDRKTRKRDFRSLWIARINAATRSSDLTYSRFMAGLRVAGIEVNRKMLAELAVKDPAAFNEYVKIARGALEKQQAAASA
ncbi:MAG: 50S ribosomal protein L20 [Candidatus Sumerlaeaceae bacterium]|nr:50S ribosomal protein L20 [Candidatus Sumerlaeaceae bacterium]